MYENEDRPGIGFQRQIHGEEVKLRPLDYFLRGDMAVDWLPMPPTIKVKLLMPNTIVNVEQINAENTFELNQSVLPNFVHADTWGYEIVNGVRYCFKIGIVLPSVQTFTIN
jgi:hypothetical protein